MSTQPTPIQRFVTEAREHLAAMTTATMSLERDDATRRAAIEQMLRAAHSIKGGAGFTGRRRIEELAHALEAALESIRDAAAAPSADAVDTLLAVQDRILAMVDDIDHSEAMDIADLLNRLRSAAPHAHDVSDAQDGWHGQAAALSGLPVAGAHDASSRENRPEWRPARATPGLTADAFALTPAMLSQPHADAGWIYGVKLDWLDCEARLGLDPHLVCERIEQVGGVLDSRTETAASLDEPLPSAPAWWLGIVASALEPGAFETKLAIPAAAVIVLRRPPEPAQKSSSSSTPPGAPPQDRPAAPAATSLRISTRLIDRLVELAGELSMVRNQTARATDPANAALRQLTRRLDAVTNEIQDAALRMRMQPVGTLFDRFPRLVRDLARQLSKQIELEITGSEVALDKAIIEMLVDPLTHLVRNCCDHGIESPDKRAAAGKPLTGTLRLSARQDRGQIVIEVRDDGKGIDAAAVKRKALQSGVKRSDELDRLSDRQVFDLILLSGFSTAEKVSDLSGRGVGMDVVKTNLDQIGGVVEIDSTPGRGTVFSLRLPLTLAIIPGLVLLAEGQRFILPQRDVEEILLLDPTSGRHRIERAHDEELLRLRGELLPVVRLADVLGRDGQARRVGIAHHESEREADHGGRCPPYAAVIRVGSHRFVLVFDQVVESESIVVKPLHALLRPLNVYAGMAILSDGNVALILSSEGVARHGGILHRPAMEDSPAAAASEAPADAQHPVLLFRYGPTELLAIPLAEVRRVVMISRRQLQLVGDREIVELDGAAVSVIRLDRFLNLSPCPEQEWLFLVLPRHTGAQAALLASEIVDSPMLPTRLDEHAFQADGVAGCAMVRGQLALFLDPRRLVAMWQQTTGTRSTQPLLPGPAAKRVLVVEDTQFFQKLITAALEAAGYQIELAGNGREGLDRLSAGAFDLVVSDLEMPVMNGFDFAREVRQDSRHDALPLLALTTLNTDENRAKAAACGFDRYEVKFDRASFLRAVDDLLQRGRSTALIRGGAGHE